MIFNSLGSNYNATYVLRSLFKQDKGARKSLELYLESKYKGKAQLVYKGRQGITVALECLNLPANSEVGIAAFTCVAVVDAIKSAGLTPLFLDINKDTLNFTAQTLKDSLKKSKVRVVIVQNTLGYACDIEKIFKICKEKNLILIEDLAHSIGTIYSNGQEAGTVGDFAIFSFGQDKAVDSVSGGAVVARNTKYTIPTIEKTDKTTTRDKIYPLLTFVIRKTYFLQLGKVIHFISSICGILSNPMKPGTQKNMSDWHAMLALNEFHELEKNLLHRRKIARIYSENIHKKVLSKHVCSTIEKATHLRYPIFFERRNELINVLKKHNAYLSSVWYKNPVSSSKISESEKSISPESDSVMLSILNLPTHINTTLKDARKISNIINAYLEK